MQSPPALFRVWRGRGATSRASPASRQKSLPSGLSYSDRCYRIALLSNRDDPVKANQMRETEAAARALGMTVQVNWVRDGADFEGAFQSIGRERAEALVFLHPDQVIAAMQRWSEEFIERPHWVAGDLPICEGSPTEEDGPFRGVALRRG